MSMLAEKKKKCRMGLNPRGNLWATDDDKFGQKLLEKMGWTKGKGLGKNEQGEKDPIRVRSKMDQKGIGCKDNNEEWTKHYENFEDVLANLNNEELSNNKDESVVSTMTAESLEARSKSSKSRVHYHKFTRGKDLSRYNENDLACVLGSKKAATKNGLERKDSSVDDQQEELTHSSSLVSINGGSLTDYFNKKMEQLKKKREQGLLGDGNSDCTPSNINCTPINLCTQRVTRSAKKMSASTPIPDLDFEPAKTDFSFSVTSPDEKTNKIEPDVSVFDKKEKRKKKKRKGRDIEMEEDNECIEARKENEVKELDNQQIADFANKLDSKPLKKKKKNKLLKFVNEGEEDLNERSSREVKKLSIDRQTENNENLDHRTATTKMKPTNLTSLTTQDEKDAIDEPKLTKKAKKRKRNDEIELNKTEEKSEKYLEEELSNCKKQCKSEPSLLAGENQPKIKKHKKKSISVTALDVGSSQHVSSSNTTEDSVDKSAREDKLRKSLRTKNSVQLNDSYLAATSPVKKKRDKEVDNSESGLIENQNKPSKRLKKFASDVSLVGEMLKSSSTNVRKKFSLERKQGVALPNEITELQVTVLEKDESLVGTCKSKKKLVSKKSFRDLTADIHEKMKGKFNGKKDKENLSVIQEDQLEETKSLTADIQEKMKGNSRSKKDKKNLSVIQEDQSEETKSLTTDIKEKKKGNSRSKKLKKNLSVIQEDQSEDTESLTADIQEKMKGNSSRKKNRKNLSINREEKSEEIEYLEKVASSIFPKKRKRESFASNLEKMFAGSNLASISGYDF